MLNLCFYFKNHEKVTFINLLIMKRTEKFHTYNKGTMMNRNEILKEKKMRYFFWLENCLDVQCEHFIIWYLLLNWYIIM